MSFAAVTLVADLTSRPRPALTESDTDKGDEMSAIAATRFVVEALPQDVATYVRENGRDPIWDHAAVTEPATGFGPCRLCLRTFREGEWRMLFTYNSYAGVAEFPQPGPVYIHRDDCDRYDAEEFPPDLRALKLTFEGVADGPRVVALERTDGEGVDEAIARVLELPEVDYVNVRNTEAGCFIARVKR
jgi:hypothetical protein